MISFLQMLFAFFRKYIWEFDSRRAGEDLKSTLTMWLKTAMLAGRIIVKQQILDKDVPALTYSSLMAMVPIMAILFVFARGIGYDTMLENWIKDAFESQPQVGQTLIEFVRNYISNTKEQYIIGVGIVMMLYTLFSLMKKIESTFNRIWKAKERTLLKMLTEYSAFFLFFAIMIIMTSAFNMMSLTLADHLKEILGMDNLSGTLSKIVGVIPMSLFFIFIYCALPNTFVSLKSAVVPGVLAGILMTTMQYYYIMIQVWLSSYNIIYGSFATIPLFLLWLKLSWTICVMGAVLCYTNQNIHHFDCDVDIKDLKYEKQIMICALLMRHICHQFKVGGPAYTARQLQEITFVPQQIVNSCLERLLQANLIEELRDNKRGARENISRYHPYESVANLTFGKMIQQLEASGESLESIDINVNRTEEWQSVIKLHEKFITEGKDIPLYKL